MVGEKCHPGYVSAVLQKGQEKEHDHDDRHKAEHASHALKNTIDDQAVDHGVDPCGSQGGIHQIRQRRNPHCQKILEKRTDHIESQVADQEQDSDKNRNSRIFSGQDPVDFPAANVLTALYSVFDGFSADRKNEGVSHIRNRSASVKPSLLDHLVYDMTEGFPLVRVQMKLFQDQLIPFNQF